MTNYLKFAKNVIDIEVQEINRLGERLGNEFNEVINLLKSCSGKVIIIGMGKSGIVGKKISATLSSTGTASVFLHPAEAFHGDLGVIGNEDIVLSISNSGETEELVKLIPFLISNGNKLISITGNPESSLAKVSDINLDIKVSKEACPLQLAPTSSTTVTLVLGDCLAVALMEAKDFKPENFARFHPGGALGKRLLSQISDMMIKKDLPFINLHSKLPEVIGKLTKGGLGICIVVDDRNKLKGVVTNGDLCRYIEKNIDDFRSSTARDIYNSNPYNIEVDCSMGYALDMMEENKIKQLIVTSENVVIGVLLK